MLNIIKTQSIADKDPSKPILHLKKGAAYKEGDISPHLWNRIQELGIGTTEDVKKKTTVPPVAKKEEDVIQQPKNSSIEFGRALLDIIETSTSVKKAQEMLIVVALEHKMEIKKSWSPAKMVQEMTRIYSEAVHG